MFHFIINPKSQSGNTTLVWHQLFKKLTESKVPFKVHTTKHSKHATELAHELTSEDKPIKLVVVGGDGFLNEVINGIQHPDKVTLGYIPSGSGNDFARSLNIPKDPSSALEIILNSDNHKICNIGYTEYSGNRKKFIVSSGIGFDAGVCHGVEVSHVKRFLNKLKLGKLVYMIVALKEIFGNPPYVLSAVLDNGEEMIYSKCLFAAVMNQPYEGGGYKFCPEAQCNDSILDVIVVNNVSPFKFLYMMPYAFSGKHVRFNTINIFQCKHATFTVDRPAPVHTDGEPVEYQNSISIGLEEETIKVIVG